MVKKIIIGIISVIGIVILLGIILFVGLVIKMANSQDSIQQLRKEEDSKVIEFFVDQYETTEEKIESVVIKNSYMQGSGSPVPFAKSDRQIRVYQLIVNNEYKATVLVDLDEHTYTLKETNFPGKLK